MSGNWVSAGILCAFAICVPVAHASTVYTLSYDGCSSGCGTAPFGTITLNQIGTTEVSVMETLAANEGFVSTGAGEALQFNILGTPTISITNLTTGFTQIAAPSHNGGNVGTFDYAIDCSGCGSGGSSTLPGPLSFDVTVGGGLTVSEFIANASGFFFASDILGTNGQTGNVGANTAPVTTTTPEPSSVALLLGGLGGLWYLRKRRAQS